MERLKKRAQFLRVASARRKSVMPGLILQVRPHMEERDSIVSSGESPPGGTTKSMTDRATARVGFTVSRKVGGAVARNRARRRLRAVAADILPRHAAPGRDYVIIGRANTLTRPFAALEGDLVAALKRLRAYCDCRETGAAIGPGAKGTE